MTARPLRPSDIPILQAIASASGYPYPDPQDPSLEAVFVSVDADDVPVAAFLAKRILEGYLIISKELHPAAKMHAVRLLQEAAPPALKAKGYDEINVFVPPSMAESFGRRLMKSFGWGRNWPSFFRKL